MKKLSIPVVELKEMHVQFYTDTGRFMGSKKAKHVEALEWKSWIDSGNSIYFNGVRYEK